MGDNALITVKLMMFYQLLEIETMLDRTNDPMSDFVNCMTADVIEWCAPKKFDEFLANTDQLNTLATYHQLVNGTAQIGYRVDRMVFRGYSAPNALQSMHDRAIEKRTSLALARETEAEEQDMADFKLRRDTERIEKQHKLELDKLEHDLRLQQKSADAARAVKVQEQELELVRIQNIVKLDKKGEMAAYLMEKDCTLPTTVNCATMMTGAATSSGSPNVPGVRF